MLIRPASEPGLPGWTRFSGNCILPPLPWSLPNRPQSWSEPLQLVVPGKYERPDSSFLTLFPHLSGLPGCNHPLRTPYGLVDEMKYTRWYRLVREVLFHHWLWPSLSSKRRSLFLLYGYPGNVHLDLLGFWMLCLTLLHWGKVCSLAFLLNLPAHFLQHFPLLPAVRYSEWYKP